MITDKILVGIAWTNLDLTVLEVEKFLGSVAAA
jgi:hypothetical protein